MSAGGEAEARRMPWVRRAVPVASAAGVIVGVALVAWGQAAGSPANGWFAYAPLSDTVFRPTIGLPQQGAGVVSAVVGLVLVAFWSGGRVARDDRPALRTVAVRVRVAMVAAGLALILLGIVLVVTATRGDVFGPIESDWTIGFGDGTLDSSGFAIIAMRSDGPSAWARPAFEVGVLLTGVALTTLAFWSGRVTSSAARRHARRTP